MYKCATGLQLTPGLPVAATQVSPSLQSDFSQVNDLLKGKKDNAFWENITENRISTIYCLQYPEYNTDYSTYPDTTREKENEQRPTPDDPDVGTSR